ncbi:TRAP transporter small permease subunit [Chloroflexota bacterium]
MALDLDKVAAFVTRQAVRASKVSVVSWVMVAVMVLYTVVNVTGRYLFNTPQVGFTDVQQLIVLTIVALALADRALNGGHVALDLLFNNLPPKPRAILGSIISLAAVSFMSVVLWASARYIGVTYEMKPQVGSQAIVYPYYIPVAIITVGFAALTLAFLSDFLNYLSKAVKK